MSIYHPNWTDTDLWDCPTKQETQVQPDGQYHSGFFQSNYPQDPIFVDFLAQEGLRELSRFHFDSPLISGAWLIAPVQQAKMSVCFYRELIPEDLGIDKWHREGF